ncbi:MAG: ATP-binding protein [Williamsia herbipolensis]|nr:ATP-binding protein [Williamsia herbipolensis]
MTDTAQTSLPQQAAAVADPSVTAAATLDDAVVEVVLPGDERVARAARALIVARWPQLPDVVLDDLRLIVTELVSNAVRHGRPDYALRMIDRDAGIDVAVLDHAEGEPVKRAPSSVDGSGRGLHLVEALSDEWGVERAPGGGKYVWATLNVEH